MPDLRDRRGEALAWVVGILVLLLGLFYVFQFLPTRARANKIHNYLGTNIGPDSTQWTGLVGRLEKDNAFHREQYTKIACEFWLLQHPGQPRPTPPKPCPPDGPPETRPPGVPKYP